MPSTERRALRVGFIGLGAMGLRMARNVMKCGFQLTVWARRSDAADGIRGEGAAWAASPGELARLSDIVILSVTNSSDVEELVEGENGLLEGAGEGLIIVDTSTISPAVTQRLAGQAAEQGVKLLDAPVSGGTQGAEAGALTIMAGGDNVALERARPVLEAMGKKIFHVGPSGSGQVVKLVNNILVGTIAAATAEALVLGAKAGVETRTMAEVVGASTGASWQLANQFPLRAFNGTFQPGFMTDLLAKDLDLVLALGSELHSPLFLTALSRQLYAESQAAGFGRDDYTSVLRIIEQAAGVEVRTS